jgi:hypothetical protein
MVKDLIGYVQLCDAPLVSRFSSSAAPTSRDGGEGVAGADLGALPGGMGGQLPS